MEREIHRSLLATRLLEARQPLMSIRDETCRALASLIDKLEEYDNVNRKLGFEQESMLKVQMVARNRIKKSFCNSRKSFFKI